MASSMAKLGDKEIYRLYCGQFSASYRHSVSKYSHSIMCELCDARARQRAVDAVNDFKPQPKGQSPTLSQDAFATSIESGGSWTLANDPVTQRKRSDETEKSQSVETDDLYALLPGSSDSTLPVLADLVAWAKSHGANLHEKVEIFVSPTHEVKLRVNTVKHDEAVRETVHASGSNTDCSRATATTAKINVLDSLPANSHIVTSPFAISLSYLNALDAFPTFPDHLGATPRFFQSWIDSVSPRIVGIFFLMQQYLLGDASFWAPYIKSLPQPKVEHLNFLALPTYGKWGPFPLRWDMSAAKQKSTCFDPEVEDCSCRDNFDNCQKVKKMPRNPYTPLKENENTSDEKLFSVDGMQGSSVLNWGDGCEEAMQIFIQMHEKEWEIPDDDCDAYFETMKPVEQLYAFHWEREVVGPLWEWAQAIFWSRSFPSNLIPDAAFGDLLDRSVREDETVTWREKMAKDGPFPVLLPLLDVLNHEPGEWHRPKVRMLVNGSLDRPTTEEMFSGGMKERRYVQIGPKDVPSVGLVNGVDIPAGGEICFNYEPKTLEEMLLGFGYERGKRRLAADVKFEVVTT